MAAGARGAVRAPPRAAPVGGGGPRLGGRDRSGRGRGRRGDPDQRGLRVRSGAPGRASGGGARRFPAGEREGAARRAGAGDRRHPPGARRRAGDRGGRPDLGGRAAAHGWDRGGSLDADRRIAAGVPLGRPVGHPGAAAPGARAGVLRYRLHGGQRASARLRHRDADRARAHRGTVRARRARREPAGGAGATGGLADRIDRLRHGCRVRPDRGIRRRPVGLRCGGVRGRPAGRQRAGGPAARDHARARRQPFASWCAAGRWSSA